MAICHDQAITEPRQALRSLPLDSGLAELALSQPGIVRRSTSILRQSGLWLSKAIREPIRYIVLRQTG